MTETLVQRSTIALFVALTLAGFQSQRDSTVVLVSLSSIAPAFAQAADKPVPVTVSNFIRAETDLYFGNYVKQGRFGKLGHNRVMTLIDEQNVVRMNRDTLYSSGVFDLQAAPLTITLPDPGKRFMSMQVVSQDHFRLAGRTIFLFKIVQY